MIISCVFHVSHRFMIFSDCHLLLYICCVYLYSSSFLFCFSVFGMIYIDLYLCGDKYLRFDSSILIINLHIATYCAEMGYLYMYSFFSHFFVMKTSIPIIKTTLFLESWQSVYEILWQLQMWKCRIQLLTFYYKIFYLKSSTRANKSKKNLSGLVWDFYITPPPSHRRSMTV